MPFFEQVLPLAYSDGDPLNDILRELLGAGRFELVGVLLSSSHTMHRRINGI